MTENRTKTTLETFSQALVVGAGLLYLFGFVIVSIFDASYGVADFSLFRTKVLAVGTLFVFLLSLPVLLTFRMFGIFGLRNRTPDPFTPSSPRARVFHFIDVALYVPFACTGIACFRQLDLAPFDLFFWPHPLVIHHSAPGRSEALRRP